MSLLDNADSIRKGVKPKDTAEPEPVLYLLESTKHVVVRKHCPDEETLMFRKKGSAALVDGTPGSKKEGGGIVDVDYLVDNGMCTIEDIFKPEDIVRYMSEEGRSEKDIYGKGRILRAFLKDMPEPVPEPAPAPEPDFDLDLTHTLDVIEEPPAPVPAETATVEAEPEPEPESAPPPPPKEPKKKSRRSHHKKVGKKKSK